MVSEYWDISRVWDSVGGDKEFISELAGIFCAACPTLLKNLEESIASRDRPSIIDSAHLLWSGARTLSAPGVMMAALAVETKARANELDDIDGAYDALQRGTARLISALTDYRNGACGSPRP